MTVFLERSVRAMQPDIALIGDELYAVLAPAATMGFVYRSGNNYVASSGTDLGHAVPIGQSLSWDEALDMVQRAFGDRH